MAADGIMSIFILGTGRSGTHWIGHILASHPGVHATIEARPIFTVATQAAIRPSRQPVLLPILRTMYSFERIRARPRLYVDKSHPVMWYADRIAQWFPDAKFVGIERSPFGTVASMLNHEGVARWQSEWRRYGVPNRFLGIESDNVDAYERMNVAERAALRWLSHHRHLQSLRITLGKRLLVLNYEEMIDDFTQQVSRLWNFVGLSGIDVSRQAPKHSPRDAWRQLLSKEQVRQVREIINHERRNPQ